MSKEKSCFFAFCDNETVDECLYRCLFGGFDHYYEDYMKDIRPGDFGFLLNRDTKDMYGIFTAVDLACHPSSPICIEGFWRNFPTQIKVSLVGDKLTLPDYPKRLRAALPTEVVQWGLAKQVHSPSVAVGILELFRSVPGPEYEIRKLKDENTALKTLLKGKIEEALAIVDAFESEWRALLAKYYGQVRGCSTEEEMYRDLLSVILDSKDRTDIQSRSRRVPVGKGRLKFFEVEELLFLKRNWDECIGLLFDQQKYSREMIKETFARIRKCRNTIVHPGKSDQEKEKAARKLTANKEAFTDMLLPKYRPAD